MYSEARKVYTKPGVVQLLAFVTLDRIMDQVDDHQRCLFEGFKVQLI